MLLAGVISPSYAAQAQPAARTSQLIITYRPGQDIGELNAVQRVAQIDSLSRAAGVRLNYVRRMSGQRQHVLRLPKRMSLDEVRQIASRLRATAGVLNAEPDEMVYPLFVPNDPRYAEQWHYGAPALKFGANLEPAWDITTGSLDLVVAIIDSGVRLDHEDLVGRSASGHPGYDMIDDVPTANDGDGRDSDPSDPGDWVTQAEADDVDGAFAGCTAEDSAWHGTHVAGTIGANGNNNIGGSGINWHSPLLHVRALGKCGGYTSDIVDGIRWAAGLAVPGTPPNPTPARVINMSLGGASPCEATSQNAINDAVAAGTVIVVAAGNANGPVAFPANCNNVIAVAATGPTGQKAAYSNFGAQVDLSAPGGDQITFSTADGVLSAVNTGLQGPVASSYAFYQGTSMAAPHVTGVASLMLSANPDLNPAQIERLLKEYVTPFATSGAATNCMTAICGTGILNAGAAVQAALNTPVFTNSPPPVAQASVPYSFTFTASGSPVATFSISGALPLGLSFDGTTGVLSGTPALSSSGTSVLTITASNGVGTDATYEFTLVVKSYHLYLPVIVR
jgi:serine protease